MSMRQFANSLSIIRRNEHANRPAAVLRHVYWQARRLGTPWPIRRRLSRSIIVDDEPGGVISLVNMLGLYDYNNMSFVTKLLTPGAVFVDVGANIGAYTLVASESSEATVISIEPTPNTFRKLSANVALNHRRNVIMVNRAASAEKGVLRMTNKKANVLNQIVEGTADDADTIEVDVDTVDGICAAHGVRPTLIKIDVEGHEPQVLAGAGACLEIALACIVENGDRASVMDIMRMRGLRGPYYYRHSVGCLQPWPQPLAEDAIFIGPSFEACAQGIRVATL